MKIFYKKRFTCHVNFLYHPCTSFASKGQNCYLITAICSSMKAFMNKVYKTVWLLDTSCYCKTLYHADVNVFCVALCCVLLQCQQWRCMKSKVCMSEGSFDHLRSTSV